MNPEPNLNVNTNREVRTQKFERQVRQGFADLFRGSLPTMCSTSWLFSLQMYSISSVLDS